MSDYEGGNEIGGAERARVMQATEMLAALVDYIKPLESVAVAFSGGVDSTLVLLVAVRALGVDSVIAVTAESETLPARELEEAKALAGQLGVSHVLLRTGEMENSDFRSNPPDRCFHCKTELWRRVREEIDERGFKNMIDGVNRDDTGDFRPGIEASDQAGALHPLVACGMDKKAVRLLAKELGLPNWEKPSQACLSSRFPYGQELTPAGLRRVDQAEELLRSYGFGTLRIRDHEGIARIEVPDDRVGELASGDLRQTIVSGLKELGYTYVTIDLEGFRSGSMNEALEDNRE